MKFIHTADWQIGMTRHFLSEGAQERFAQARFDAIRRLGQIAREEGCAFIAACGDVFESNQIDRKTVARAMDALKDVPVPVYLLPGNHDPLNYVSVFNSTTFKERKPAHVHVIANTDPIRIADGVELIGIPWFAKGAAMDLMAPILAALAPAGRTTRIILGHGILDRLNPAPAAPGLIAADGLEQALQAGKCHYIALGDRHSVTKVDAGGRIWYSGAPEATDYNERSGFALVVEIDGDAVQTREVQTGKWQFIERDRVDLNTPADIAALREWLDRVANKECAVVKLRLTGTLTLALHGELIQTLDTARDLLAAIEVRDNELAVIPDDADFTDLAFSGFAGAAVACLRARATADTPEAAGARDALMLLVRLARSAQ
ncbi:MAG: DNA repair exonuclease [Planctomycetota bacterium]